MTQVESIRAEHARLQREVAELQRERESLEQQQPFDVDAHAKLNAKIHAKLTELREHDDRLKREL
jgi:hypothetical protein